MRSSRVVIAVLVALLGPQLFGEVRVVSGPAGSAGGGGGGDVLSVFGRAGVVSASQSDYDSFFLTPAEAAALFAGLSHAHSAADVTSGTMPISRGGTGLTVLGSANKLLGVNSGGTSNEYKSLVAGTNVTITHGDGTITIDADPPGGVAGVSSFNGRTGDVTLGAADLPDTLTFSSAKFYAPSAGSGLCFYSVSPDTLRGCFAMPSATTVGWYDGAGNRASLDANIAGNAATATDATTAANANRSLYSTSADALLMSGGYLVNTKNSPTPAVGQVLTATSSTTAAWQTPATGGVSSSRAINTTAPLSGGGDLSADRTLSVATFGSANSGVVPASGGGTTNYLRADGTWAAPSGGAGVSTFETRSGAVVSAPGDYTASEVTNVAAGTIAATNVQTALNELDTEKAPLASPTFTGVPAAPTATAGTNTTQIATTAFVTTAASAATGLKSATTTVSVSAATAPTAGQVLTATSGTAATWQTPAAGGGGTVYDAFSHQIMTMFAQSSTTTFLCDLCPTGSAMTVSAATSANPGTSPFEVKYSTSAVNGNVASFSAMGQDPSRDYHDGSSYLVKSRIYDSTNVRYWIGIGANGVGGGDDPAPSGTGIAAFRYSTAAGDTVWKAYACNSEAYSCASASTSKALATGFHTFRISFTATQALFYIDGSLEATLSVGLYSSGSAFGGAVSTLTTSAKGIGVSSMVFAHKR